MENLRKKRKLMSSRIVPGAAGVAGRGVLINAGSDGNGGGGVVGGRSGGVVRGTGAMAAVRGRTLPRTGQRALQDRITVNKRETLPPTNGSTLSGKGSGNSAIPKPPSLHSATREQRYRLGRIPGTIQEDPDKENAASTTGSASQSSKRVREKEGDGFDSALPSADEFRRPKITALRMAKNAGETRIPMPGSIRASFLPKPKIVTQHKVTGIEKLTTPQKSGHRASVKTLIDSVNLANKGRGLVASTPYVEGKLKVQHGEILPFSPVDEVSCEDIGKTVRVGEEKIGILRYYGLLDGEAGPWCGIELPEADGLNDGAVRGFRYFSCPEKHGIMAPAAKVRRVFSEEFVPQQKVLGTKLLSENPELQVNDGANVSDQTFVTGQVVRGGELVCRWPPDSLSPSGGVPVAEGTFSSERNDRMDADFDQGGDWKFCVKSTPNTSSVVTPNDQQNATIVVRTGETNDKLTNETQLLDDENKRTFSVIENTENRIQPESEGWSKTPSPTPKTKIPFGSRLVLSNIYGKSSFPSANGATAKNTDPIVKSKGTSQNGNETQNYSQLSSNPVSVAAPKRICDVVTSDLTEESPVTAAINIPPAPKPTGAIFKLNDSFMNEKPLNGNAAVNFTKILYGNNSPVVEVPFSKKLTYICGKNSSGNDMSPANDETFDKPDGVADLSPSNAKQNCGTIPGKNMGDTFSIGGGKINDLSLNGKINNSTFVFDDGKLITKPVDTTFSMNRKSGNLNDHKLDDTFFVRAPSKRSFNLSGNANNLMNPGRESILEFPSIFDDSHLIDQIENVGDSCLVDTSSFSANDTVEVAGVQNSRGPTNRCSLDSFVARAFCDSKISLIDEVGDSCLIDTTLRSTVDNNEPVELGDCLNLTVGSSIGGYGTSQGSEPCEKVDSDKLDLPSGPYSLLGLNGTEEDDELTPPAAPPPSKATPAPHYLMLNKQNSFEHDESLGILTPDQMAEFSMTLECSRTPSCENLTGSGGSRIAMTRASASRPSDLPTSVDGEPTEGSSERTPSPEDLPLDPKPAEPARTVPVSFITSVTSITSLEAGYQGDGENSRPASRGADPAPVAPPPNLPAPRTDPMTDSDFFTESDADAHEEIGRGDRRAQVIDGTLFCAPGGRRCPSFTGEEMDSSGIYSDLDRRQDDQPHEEAQSEGQTPDTADTESQKSQPSPHQQDNLTHQQIQQPVIMEYLQMPSNNLDSSVDSNASVGTMEGTVIEVENLQTPPVKELSKSPEQVPLQKYKMPKRNVVSKIKAMIESGPKDESGKEARRPQRTPRKGGRWDAVMSKIEAGKNEQRTRPPRKEVKSRVLQNLGLPPSTTNRRSPGDSNKSKRRIRGRQDVVSPTQETAQSSVHSSMSDISSAPRSGKKRLGSPGGSEGSAQSTPRISSPRQQQPPSSLTIVNNVISTGNLNNNNNNNNNTNIVPAPAVGNGTGNVNGNNIQRENSTRPIPSHSQRSPTAGNPPRRVANGRTSQQSRINNYESKKNSLDVSRINLEKSPSATRKPAVPRRSTSNIAPKTQNVSPPKDRGAKETTPVPRGIIETREQAHQTDPTHEDIHLKQAEVSVQALSVIVQYLAHQLDGFSTPRLKKDCERMKTEWLEARLEAEELRAGYRRVEQQLTEQHDERQRALNQLQAELESRHANRLTELETALQEERQKCEARLQETINSSNKELEITVARLRTEHEADLVRKEAETDRRSAVHDQGAALRAEAESLRTVLELRSQEIAALRAENDNLRREVEIKEALEAKVIALEARSEDLKAQLQRKETFERQLSHENKILLESFHQESKQNKRLSQHNEELQWRLRQNNEVVTVLANQLATPSQRLTRSLGPEHTGHSQSPDDSPPASPMVKSMVEKSDSVSWTLEIEETPEAMASRLLRRSGSSRGISPSDSRPKRARQPSSSSPVTTATVSRQSSLRTTTPQRAVVLRTRSKSVSVADAVPQESWTTPGFTSTPSVVRRRPRSDPAGSPVVAVQETNPGLRPQEAGGEAMISEETSASSSEDESSASSDIPRLAMELSWSESEG